MSSKEQVGFVMLDYLISLINYHSYDYYIGIWVRHGCVRLKFLIWLTFMYYLKITNFLLKNTIKTYFQGKLGNRDLMN